MGDILALLFLTILIIFLVRENDKRKLKMILLNILKLESRPVDLYYIRTKYLKLENLYCYHNSQKNRKYSNKIFNALKELFDEDKIGKVGDCYYYKVSNQS